MAPDPQRRNELGEDVGTQLRRARNLQGITRLEAARDLEVPEQFLADLEEGRLWPFGPRMHVAAYVRVYARYLDLDPDEVLGPSPSEPVRGIAGLAGDLRLRWVLASAAVLLGLGALAGITVVLAQGPEQETSDVTFVEASNGSGPGRQGSAPHDETEVRSQEAQPRTEPERDAGEEDQPGSRESPALFGEEPGQSEDEDAGGSPDSDPPVGEGVEVQLLDGAEDPARLEDATRVLEDLGYEIVFVDRTASTYEETTVLHAEDETDYAASLLAADDRFTRTGDDPGLTVPADLHVIVGLDWPEP